ncbi:type II toxin-antitoxin system CcdA family antitoxin [Roseomonas sp. AR75]|uniref:type II toxin-antitoxin system CcdA family antitoxin n=1 Tax=Roseomonas sp. AR75 TaxID=2562311 RepID=UPI0010C0AB09|nr:type II toxin-antitoxin system CcdA family antitoxin [Roseomonas sp. AR75]
MNAPFGPKRRLEIELDEELAARAEALGVNISRVAADAVAARVAETTPSLQERRDRAEAHARFSKAFIERYGGWGDEFSTL